MMLHCSDQLLGFSVLWASPLSNPVPADTPATHSMGFIGCSMAENVAQGYVADGGKRMWGPYGTGGMVVQSWTSTTSSSWQLFDKQVASYGKPTAVWVQICIFTNGATYDEVKQLIANARQHAAPGAQIYITGQPLYDAGQSCFLAGRMGRSRRMRWPRRRRRIRGEVQDGCHANTAGQASLGKQAVAFWG
ncbi:hypothetical protein QBC46DRAFT_460333 [Diplogelasinospora grovesii]|uniref:Uncharacterized protein n=1 Tax=Diplogelasinospora grovesii TaxID=303347 RepID=A0AAN6N5V0_9PEZI|nr:hypothetical protein QBC46DRAFT_460333 [Diplogelasinospora grovesii]